MCKSQYKGKDQFQDAQYLQRKAWLRYSNCICGCKILAAKYHVALGNELYLFIVMLVAFLANS